MADQRVHHITALHGPFKFMNTEVREVSLSSSSLSLLSGRHCQKSISRANNSRVSKKKNRLPFEDAKTWSKIDTQEMMPEIEA